LKDESKNSIEEYQDAERRNDSRIFLPNLINKRIVESDWRRVKFIAAARAILREDGKDPS
jgi:ribosomal protein L28